MTIKFKIISVDDKPRLMKPILKKISELLQDNHFIPDVDENYDSSERFSELYSSLPDDEYGSIFNDCDLLLIDNNLASTSENAEKTGEILIQDLRKKGIYTEAVFYSDGMKDYRENKNNPELDNVIYADKNELTSKVEKIIKKKVAQSISISNLRGHLMDCTSNFDFACREIAAHYFSKLDDDAQKQIIEEADGYIRLQYSLEISKFNDIIGLDSESFPIGLRADQDAERRLKDFRKIFDSQEYIISTRHKFRLLAMILRLLEISCASDIHNFNPNSKEEKEKKDGDIYQKEIVSNRNSLAHNKLTYGLCKEKIKIIKTMVDFEKCEGNFSCSQDCYKSYTRDKCIDLRKNIYKYHLIFDKLLEDVESEMDK